MKYHMLLEVLETEGEPIVSQKCFVLGETSLHFAAHKRCVFKRSRLRSCKIEAVRTPVRLTLAQFRLPGIRLRRRLQRLAQPSAWRSLLSGRPLFAILAAFRNAAQQWDEDANK